MQKRRSGPRPGVILDVGKIEDILIDRRQTYTQFARQAGMNRSTVTNILSTGRRCNRMTATWIARGLGLELDDILADADEEAELAS